MAIRNGRRSSLQAQPLESAQQIDPFERLDDDGIDSSQQGFTARLVVIHPRKQHELEVTHVGMCPYPAAEIESRHAGHHDIDKRDLRPFHIEQRHRSLRIRCNDDTVSGMAQDDAH